MSADVPMTSGLPMRKLEDAARTDRPVLRWTRRDLPGNIHGASHSTDGDGTVPIASVNGVNLSYEDRGGSGIPLLLICGTNMRAEMWDGFGRPALDEAGYRTIAFDNRGIEPSGVTEPPYTTQLMADDAVELLERLGIEEAFVMGASLGANIAQTVALKRPDLVRAAVLAVGGGNYSASGRMSLELSSAAMTAGGEVRDLAFRAQLLDATLPGSQRHDDDAIAFVLQMLGDNLLNVSDWNGLMGQMEANLAWAAEDHLSELTGMDAPALVIAHEFDNNFSVAGREAMVDTIPEATMVLIEGAAHVPLDPAASEASSAATLKFFAGHR